jgi:Domain of unknown function (DUF4157)
MRAKRAGRAQRLEPEVRARLARFFPGLNLDRIRVYEGIPWYVKGAPLAYADRHRIYFQPGAYRPDSGEGLALIAHELVHCWQYQRHGTWRFRARYLAAYFRNRLARMSDLEAYLNIPFEVEARSLEESIAQRAGPEGMRA